MPYTRIGIGQDSHRFLDPGAIKPCIIGGLIFPEAPGLDADSDGDVVFHAICNAITSVTGIAILGDIAIKLCHQEGVTSSQIYLKHALKTLRKQEVQHVALTIEGKRPRLQNRVDEMRQSIARVMQLEVSQVGITVTSGNGLTDFGCGDGLQCFCILTTMEC
ncbi:2-C-methyl-D-erythritol 2,4-cyclodiphosphate synthase [Candidatus Rhabdochlamydia oedothoracis]|uniref:2-C-methyl-D-erythritol 2,4-cyclodiphosphate synthase n=1 Tax=Candidatus Rhabdochlamydia oedothoracis TaxID=2720720 RepID=A0ABX8UZF1_9BACT|nr:MULTISPECIES: 2-C-methyl-D-erythritol 2,4-cyclodiphosphate synthase [Rhabdochlamydia]KAG6559542.1 2-C-methyl-D-erythritol 2,4-cyclodiphosphate synthase [Candidatus Rhabdochlamydia sp. W815]MCL6755895.1 2-C-methyl-D-erythritol 2,4-cyclodiphosphate synthase [Candidatus Rhabdochlamydia oedothoracis]QYF48236.1 2-C-methyl-D-erythritol 2,4-cyclodiphosphate synthase [Candidatus Rhabdochlamydia oedothoracis]